MIKKIIGSSICIFFLLTTVAFASIPSHIEEFAKKEGINKFKEILSEDPSSLIDYGFKDLEELNRVALGVGFQVHMIDPEKLQKANPSTEIRSIIKETDQWEFVVYLDGFPKSILGIGIENGEWSVTKAGGYANHLSDAYDELTALNQKEEPLLFYAQGTPILLSKKDDIEIIATKSIAEHSKLFPNTSESELSPVQALLLDLKTIQTSPNQNEDSGRRVEVAPDHNVGKEQSIIVVITISTIVALLAVYIVFRIITKKQRNRQSS